MTTKELERIADQAEKDKDINLAVVLYAYLGSKEVGVDDSFAAYCRIWAEEGVKQIEEFRNRKNN